jgi:hypothetical protein
MATFSTFLKSIYRDGNDGKAFERFIKWFLTHDPEWKTQVNGDSQVPQRHVTSNNFRLGSWVNKQRSKIKEGRLDSAHETLLRGIGFQ